MAADALLAAVRHVWLTLRSLEVPAALMGGLALAVWKHVRATRDVDLLIGIGERDPQQLIEQLRAAGIRPKRSPPLTNLGRLQVIQLVYEPPDAFVDLQVDLLLAASEYHLEALRRRIGARLPDFDLEFSVLRCEDMILHKLLAGRIIDRADAAVLLRANRESLEMDYLTRQIGVLGLTSELSEIWKEAFPGTPVK